MIELKSIIQVLGWDGKVDIEKIETPEDFKALFEKDFTLKKSPDKETINHIVGAEYGKLGVAMKKFLKKSGSEFDLSDDDFKKKDFVDLFEYGLDKVKSTLSGEIETLKKNQGSGDDEKVKEMESELNKYKLRYTEAESLKEKLAHEYNEFKGNSDKQFKEFKKKTEISEIQKQSIKFASGVNDLTKKGFFSTLDEKYSWDYNEKGELLPTDKTGNFIPHPKEVGKYLTPQELYEMEGVKADIWEKNANSKARPVNNQPAPIQNTEPSNRPAGMPVRQIAPRAS